MTSLKALLAMLAGASFLLALGGCNTMEGAGQDMKAAGVKVQTEANEHKGY